MTKRLTTQQLEAIRKRAEAATEGPWIPLYGYDGEAVIVAPTNEHGEIATNMYDHDAELIANAREDIPMLLAEIERLRGINVLINDTVSWGVSCSECSNQLAENWEIIGGAFICAECTEEMEEIRNDREEA